ncbi:MAG TPA: ferritin [Chloroflexi bacterium]|nr:ferritin [Chloroflexota bacterium]
MPVNKKLNDALNDEIGLELFAHSQYLAMGCYLDARGFSNLAQFFYRQAEEEKEHALRIIKYLNEAGGTVRIPAVDEPKHEFASLEELAQLFLDQEQHVTDQFYRMVELSLKEKDYATHQFLQWFVEEQVEEVDTATRLLQLVQMAGEENAFHVEMMVAHWE